MIIELVFIDDEEDILNLLRLKFRSLAKNDKVNMHLFSTSEDFEKYIKEVKSEVIVVVSDINMPNNKVLEALKEEKERFNFSLTYLCSAYAQEEFKDMIEDNNVKFFFKKPLNINNIKDKLLEDLEERGIRF